MPRWSHRSLALVALLVPLALFAGPRADDEDDDEKAPSEPPGKVYPILNVAGHSGAIHAMAFGKGNKRLFTVGHPGELQEWHVDTGEQLRVWRFPEPVHLLAYWVGKGKGKYDGQRIAVAGRFRPTDKKTGKAELPIWVVDLPKGAASLIVLPPREPPKTHHAHRLAFSNDGEHLAVGIGGSTDLVRVGTGKIDRSIPKTGLPSGLAFDKTNKWLAIAKHKSDKGFPVRLWNLKPAKGEPESIPLKEPATVHPVVAWAPNGQTFAVIAGGDKPTAHVYSLKGTTAKVEHSFGLKDLTALLPRKTEPGPVWYPLGLVYRSNTEALAAFQNGLMLRLYRIDTAGKQRLQAVSVNEVEVYRTWVDGMALSRDGKTLGITTYPSFQATLIDADKGKQLGRVGTQSEMPRVVGWTAKGDGLVWSPDGNPDSHKGTTLPHGVNLDTLTPLEAKDRKLLRPGSMPAGWSITAEAKQATLKRPGKKPTTIALDGVTPALTRQFQAGGKTKLFVAFSNSRRLAVVDPDTGTPERYIGKLHDRIYDAAASPDGKLAAVAAGSCALAVYNLEAPLVPLLQVVKRDHDWIAWTVQGYFAGSAGGDRLIGWKVTTENDRLASFYPADKFAKRLYQPEVIRQVLRTGSVTAAVKAARTVDATVSDTKVEDLLPPDVKITKVTAGDGDDGVITVEAEATSQSKGQALTAMRLMVDGRPLPDDKGIEKVAGGKASHKVTWSIPRALLPAGERELSVTARCPDVSGASPPQTVEVPEKLAKRPVLHLVAVGIDYADKPGMKLGKTLNDAKAIFDCFKSDAVVGVKNHCIDCKAHLMLNGDATRQKILDRLKELRKEVKMGDLVVFFFAGHGGREKKEFYLVASDTNPKDLAGTGLSGGDLQARLRDIPSHVLVILDACHSGAIASATDTASRRLTDEDCAVAILMAAMGYEFAREPAVGTNGYFTAALLKALAKSKNVLHDTDDKRQWLHHLFTTVQDGVRKETKNQQNPFMTLPPGRGSFVVRKIVD